MANDDLFGGFEGREEEVTTFRKRDFARHSRYLKARFLLADGTWNFRKQITLPMEIGDWVEMKDGKRRGSNEVENEQAFRDAARDLQVGIRFGNPNYTRDENGLPIVELRFKLEPQREFTEEAVNLRVLAQSIRLAEHWRDASDSAEVDAKRKEAKARLDNAVADARRINTAKTRDALQKYGIPVVAPTTKKAAASE